MNWTRKINADILQKTFAKAKSSLFSFYGKYISKNGFDLSSIISTFDKEIISVKMDRFPMNHQGENLSFQQYGVVLFTQLFHGGNFSETVQKVEGYIIKVNNILQHVGENKFVRNTQQHIDENVLKITVFTAFVKAYLKSREKLMAQQPNGRIEHMTHLLVRLIAHANLSHAHALLIHKLCHFHSEFCDILNQIEGKALIPQEIPE